MHHLLTDSVSSLLASVWLAALDLRCSGTAGASGRIPPPAKQHFELVKQHLEFCDCRDTKQA